MFDIAKGGRACASSEDDRAVSKESVRSSEPRPAGRRPGAGYAGVRVAVVGEASTKGRILVADDSLLMADLAGDALREHGYAVVGPAGALATACELARTADLDGAVLDLKLDNDFCFQIAAHLKARGVPFIVLTGHPKWRDVPAGFEPVTWLAKPVARADLVRAVDTMLAARQPHDDRPTKLPRALATGRVRLNGKGVRVFLVEGDSRCRANLAALLMRQGFEVQSFDEDRTLCESLARDGEHHRLRLPAGDVACGNLALDQGQRRATWNRSVVPLSAGEFEIVLLLASNAGHYVGHRAIYDCLHYEGFVGGHGDNGFCVNVRSAIRRIRQKFRAVDSNFCEIENSWAFGYCWRQDSSETPPGLGAP